VSSFVRVSPSFFELCATNGWNFFQDETVRELFVGVNDECDDDEQSDDDERGSDEIERGAGERNRVVLGDAKGWVRVRVGGFELRTVLRETFGTRGRGVSRRDAPDVRG